jgi:hypothetical protein
MLSHLAQLLRLSPKSSKRLKAIHYYTVPWDDARDRTPEPVAIVVLDLATGNEKVYSLHRVAERNGIRITEIPSRRTELERGMLEEFYEDVRKARKTRWLHWNMRNEQYGFPALAHRFHSLGGALVDVPDIPLARQINLAAVMKDTFGPRYAPDPRLPNLTRQLRLSTLDYLDLEQLTAAARTGEYGRLVRSLIRVVGNIACTFRMLCEDRLHAPSGIVERVDERLPGTTTVRNRSRSTSWRTTERADAAESEAGGNREQCTEAAGIETARSPGSDGTQLPLFGDGRDDFGANTTRAVRSPRSRRMPLEQANAKAMQLAQADRLFVQRTIREWAKAIGCSTGLVHDLPLWKETMKRTGRGRPVKTPAPKAISLTPLIEEVTGEGEREEMLNQLIAEQQADQEPSPLDDEPPGARPRNVHCRKRL